MTKSIIKAHVTERSSVGAASTEHPVYTFVIDERANKLTVAKEILATYQVKPVKVNVSTVQAKAIFYRGKWGKKPGFKKAVVYLKAGDKINLA